MSILELLAARFAFIACHMLAGGLAVAVIQLDLLRSGGPALTAGSAAYIFVLHVAALATALALDYRRQQPFCRRASEIAAADDPLAAIPSLPPARTPQQRITADLARAMFSAHAAEALARDERERLRVDFTNRWVHGMKTPVSVIDLLVQQSREARSLDEALPLFDSIQEEAERISHALEMMLGMARQERFSVDLAPQQVDLLEVARAVVNKHRKEFIRYSIYPTVECHSSNSTVETDEKWITFVVDQLVSNAIKYTRLRTQPQTVGKTDPDAAAGRVWITIDCAAEPAGDLSTAGTTTVTTLTVRDNGIGIPAHDLPRVFEPFFTGDNGRLAPESTGMGLFLAKKVCAGLGHTIKAESEPGQGTAITIAFSNTSITRGLTIM